LLGIHDVRARVGTGRTELFRNTRRKSFSSGGFAV
jgi:hypothetical protein